MKPIFIFLISQSILLPILAGLIRWRRIDKSYQPFLLLLAVGFVTEVISFVMIQEFHKNTNAVPVNIYALIEWNLIAWQFHVWGLLKQKKWLFCLLSVCTSLLWVIENLVYGNIDTFSPFFRFFYFFMIVLMSVNKINFMITHDRHLFQNPIFLICIGFIIYFLYTIMYEWAYQMSRHSASDITSDIIMLMAYVNALANIIYATAFLLIPAPQKFTLK